MSHDTTGRESTRQGLSAHATPRSASFVQAAAVLAFSLLSTIAPTAYALNDLTFSLEDYSAAPQTGTLLNGSNANSAYVARLNFIRPDPADNNRIWVNDLNGQLYIVDRTTKTYTTLLDFNRRPGSGHTGLFEKLGYDLGFAGGFITFQFHPEYAKVGSPHYGVFYTVHMEQTNLAGSQFPNNSSFPGFDNSTYTPTPLILAPGAEEEGGRDNVLIEWRDTDITDTVFTGTAREIIRTQTNRRIHPMGDLIFNPLACPGHPDYGNMYIAHGDGADGEKNDPIRHLNPQSLACLVGKILRINPDDPDGAGPLNYSVPADNPFVSTVGARPEIWAYGFRNCHRFTWDIFSNKLIVSNIGFHDWEETEIVEKGGNYGWADREGTHVFDVVTGNGTLPLPANDATLGYIYPVIEYPHVPNPNYGGYGDAIADGFVYRGIKFPFLWGKYIFGDITTGDLYYANYSDMLAAYDGNPATLAPFKRIILKWDTPLDADTVPETFNRMYEIVEDGYEARGGPANNLPGTSTVSGTGRADIRIQVDRDGEPFILSKSDGMIRRIASIAVAPEFEIQPQSATVKKNKPAVFLALAIGEPLATTYQWQRAPFGSSTFTNVTNSSTYFGATSPLLIITKATTAMSGDQFRVIATNAAGSTTSDAATLTVTN